MSKKYCLHCNFGTEFSDIPPKFCSNCSKPFASTIAANVTESIPPVKSRRKTIILEDNEEDDIETVPQINQIEFEIAGSDLSGEELLRQRGHTSYKDIKNSPFRERVAIKDIGRTLPPVTRPKQKGRPQKPDIKKFNQEFYGEVVQITKDNSEVGE